MLLVGTDSSATVMQDIQPTGAASVPGNGKNASATDFSIAAIMAKGAPPVKDKTSPEVSQTLHLTANNEFTRSIFQN
ncbi:hypothetical protein TNIN_127351 [Trichonephila inaurata madagascariensis]|uniref:Uncharacterized protein n=1 Tax=Trichonephila inaurata madagascariensis TaxID=2747483 RepID=A0A8X6KNQ5_9ARAC|nr:hypothetical protein TNIN_127351 [Trichonephila inaurata madagascariensis]